VLAAAVGTGDNNPLEKPVQKGALLLDRELRPGD
jgi:hypothetical protein